MKPLSQRERKLVAVAILLAIVAAVWLAAVQPLISGFAERAARREELRERLAANERLIATIPRLRQAAEAAVQRQKAFALPARTEAEAGEILRERLETALAAAGGELRASEVLEGEPGWARASASGLVSNAQLTAWLAALANQPPYLSLDALTIGAERAGNSNQLDLMDVRVEASIPLLAAKPQ